MLNSVFSSFRSSSKKTTTVGEKRERHSPREDEDSEVITTDVLQTPPHKRTKNKETGTAVKGTDISSSPREVISGWFKGAMNWADKYSAWNYVVGKKKCREKPKTVITLNDDDNVKEHKTSDVVYVRSTSPEVIILDNYRRPTTHIKVNKEQPGPSKEIIVIDSFTQRRPLHQYISQREKESSVSYTQTPLRPSDEFSRHHKPVLNIPTLLPATQRHENPNDIFRHDKPKENRSSIPLYHRAPDHVSAVPQQQKPAVLNNTRTLPSFNIGKHPSGAGKVRVRQHTKENTRKPLIYQRHRSTAKDVVRLEEKQRYIQLLSQFTTSSLSHDSDNSVIKNKENSILGSPYQSSDANCSIVSIKPPLSQRRLIRPSQTSLLSPRSSLLPSQTSLTHGGPLSPVAQPTVLKVKPTVPKSHVHVEHVKDLPLYTKQKSFTSENRSISTATRTQQHKPQRDSLSDEWTKKWRNILSPENLSREREHARILREEKRLEELQAKRQEERRAAVEEVKERIRIEEESEEEEEEEDEEEEDASEFVPLSDEMEREIDRALAPGNPSETLVDGFKISVTRGDIVTLSNLNWLNDEVINFYFSLVTERSKSPGYPKVHSFNSFFYPKLIKTGYDSLKRWTRRVDIFTFDLIIVPIHLGMHWCLAAIDFRNKTITYYDSLKGSNSRCLEALKNYLTQESMDKKKVPYDTSNWTLSSPKDIPEQLNGCDCGVFACKYAEYIGRDAKFTFNQRNMPYFRRRMVYEILKLKLF